MQILLNQFINAKMDPKESIADHISKIIFKNNIADITT